MRAPVGTLGMALPFGGFSHNISAAGLLAAIFMPGRLSQPI